MPISTIRSLSDGIEGLGELNAFLYHFVWSINIFFVESLDTCNKKYDNEN